MTPDDAGHMRRALELAERGLGAVSPNPPVGCVLVDNGRLIAEGWHERYGSAHAEAMALKRAGGRARGATAYVTLEPCSHWGKQPPCADALIHAGVKRVVIAVRDPDPSAQGGGAILANAGIQTEFGLFAEEAVLLARGFYKYHAAKMPFVALKYALTLDGKTASFTGDSRWISGPESRAAVQVMRNQSDAIMVGIGTVLKDNPLLTPRPELPPEAINRPKRVIVDSHCRLPADSRMLREPGGEIWVAVGPEANRENCDRLRRAGVVILDIPGTPRIDLKAFLREMAKRGVRNILCEGGAELAGGLVEAGLVDEIIAFVAPKIIGGQAAPGAIGGQGLEKMSHAPILSNMAYTQIGDDFMIRGRLGDWKWMRDLLPNPQ